MSELEHLEAAIAAQEQLRGSVPDAVIDVAVAALRHHAELAASSRPKQRKLITVLFADVSGSTTLGEAVDAEELSDLFDSLWRHLDAIIHRHGGRIDKHIGDAVMALWGVDHAREDDPERAIRAALEMQSTLREIGAGGAGRSLTMRIGINTGPVVLGEIAGTEEFTAMGDTVNVAARLEAASPLGAVLVGHDTYRHVRGVFTVRLQAPLTVRGKRSALRTYVVEGIRPRVFRLRPRGIEGVEPPMIGRDDELAQLRGALSTTIATSTPTVVTVVGEPGAGKSRLIYEFEDWLRVRPDDVRLFTCRADLRRRDEPFSLIRDLLLERFEIAEDDPTELAQAKLTVGFRELAGQVVANEAAAVGQLVGISVVDGSIESRDLVERAGLAIGRLLAGSAAAMPVVVLVEDIHWADRSSLELLATVERSLKGSPVLVVQAARPANDRAVQPPTPEVNHRTIVLEPLSDSDAVLLVDELLQHVATVPDSLRDDIVRKSAGSPFFIEELIRMMIDDDVIVVDDEWTLRPELLGRRSIPPTVSGVIQARLDLLSAAERATLQRAAVVGAAFWDAALPRSACSIEPVPEDAAITLARLASKGLVERAPTSGFNGTVEYHFQHATLHEVTYESVLLQDRRVLHRDVAEWLAARVEGRSAATAVARHFLAAGEVVEAARWFAEAAHQARSRGATGEAIDACENALAADVLDDATALGVLDDYCESLTIAARYDDALSNARSMEHLAEHTGDPSRRALALMHQSHLHVRLGMNRVALGEARRAHELVRAAHVSSSEVIDSMIELSWVLLRLGHAEEAVDRGREALALVDAATSVRIRRGVHSLLGAAANALGRYALAAEHIAEALALDRLRGDRRGEAANLINLGEVARLQGDLPTAIALFTDSEAIVRSIGDRDQEALVLSNLGGAHVELGDLDAALTHLDDAVRAFETSGGTEHSSETHRFRAQAHLAAGDVAQASRAAHLAMDLALEDENPDHLGHAWRLMGLIASRAGADAGVLGTDGSSGSRLDAEECLLRSVEVFANAAMERDRALAMNDLADVVAAGGDLARAADLRAEVRRLLGGLELWGVLARLDARSFDEMGGHLPAG
ncbi:MAG TPA: adenylate/guanylate cyclase domain-containing protein [Ilumatobacteraceae bacterium]|nr:adenylate/guanylate cyclase domain-containing protein [Ilumatobacteraceae bacterium]